VVRGVLGAPAGFDVSRHLERGLPGRYVHRRRCFLVVASSDLVRSPTLRRLWVDGCVGSGLLGVGVGMLKFLPWVVTWPRSLVHCQLAIEGNVVNRVALRFYHGPCVPLCFYHGPCVPLCFYHGPCVPLCCIVVSFGGCTSRLSPSSV
jgi:hypothetical protein